MNRHKQTRSWRPSLRIYLLAAFTLTMLIGLPQSALAQSQWMNNGNNISTTNNTANVGVGTATPGAKVDIVPTNDSFFDGVKVQRPETITQYGIFSYAYGTLGLTSVNTTSALANNYGRTFFFNQSDGSSTRTAMIIDGSGNVSIGATNPSYYRLNVVGDNSSSYPILKLQNTQTNGRSWWLYSGAFGVPGALGIYDETAGSYRMFFDSSGNVGVGTTAPGQRLTVLDSKAASYSISAAPVANASIYNVNNTGNNNEYSSLQFQVSADNTVNTNAVGYLSLIKPSNTSNAGDFGFTLRKVDNTYGEVLRLQSNGNVGIGTSSPTAKLDVNGNANVTGNFHATGTLTAGTIEARYQDVAEWVPATHALPAGTVVTLNPTQNNQVTASSTAYDTRVAGVISERPGLALGAAGKDKVLVATVGRVKVKVDASRAPIQIGDLLVTSDKEGVAMKSEPVEVGGVKLHRPGTLIGKALEPIDKGTGEILVLLSLQ